MIMAVSEIFCASALGISRTLLSTAHGNVIAAENSGRLDHPSDILDLRRTGFQVMLYTALHAVQRAYEGSERRNQIVDTARRGVVRPPCPPNFVTMNR
jgi:hypothetical protein